MKIYEEALRCDLLLFNAKDGLDRGADVHLLRRQLPTSGVRPSIVAFNEAVWVDRRFEPARRVVSELGEVYGGRYEIAVGAIQRSDHPPALAWDSSVFHLHSWSSPESDPGRYTHNTALLSLTSAPDVPVARVQLVHLDYASSTMRRIEAEVIAPQIRPGIASLVLGDFNSTASGPHFGDRDWSRVPAHKRREKGKLEAGRWVKDTGALDILCGSWDRVGHKRRSDGAGLRLLAETDWEQRGRPPSGIAVTTLTDQPLPIDLILATEDVDLVPGTYRVHPPSGAPVSDHLAVSASVRIPIPQQSVDSSATPRTTRPALA